MNNTSDNTHVNSSKTANYLGNPKPSQISVLRVFLIFLRLGLSSFGGPVAHIAYFRTEFVGQQKWLSDRQYSEIVALCQFLPGPASSQVGLTIGFHQAGYCGALGAWLGFTLPSAIALTCFAFGLSNLPTDITSGVVYGLKIVTVAIVAQAVWAMAKSLCPNLKAGCIMLGATLIVSFIPTTLGQLLTILLSGLVGWLIIKPTNKHTEPESLAIQSNKKTGAFYIVLFFILLAALPLIASLFPSQTSQSLSSFYHAGSLVFGGGHVVLPLLETKVVASGLVSSEEFLTGYGAAQAVPGPLFTFASFLGATMYDGNMGWYGSLLCLLAIFLPAFLLIAGVLPFWQHVSNNRSAQTALAGANAGVVGLLLALLYDPIWTSTVHGMTDLALVILGFAILVFSKVPAWGVVLGFGVLGFFIA